MVSACSARRICASLCGVDIAATLQDKYDDSHELELLQQRRKEEMRRKLARNKFGRVRRITNALTIRPAYGCIQSVVRALAGILTRAIRSHERST